MMERMVCIIHTGKHLPLEGHGPSDPKPLCTCIFPGPQESKELKQTPAARTQNQTASTQVD